MRALLVFFASASGYLIVGQLAGPKLSYIGIVSGMLIAVAALVFEERVKKTPLRIVAGGAAGLTTGLVVANLITYPLVSNFLNNGYIELGAYVLSNFVIGYLGLSIGMKKGDELAGLETLKIRRGAVAPDAGGALPAALIIDTNIVIDGRVAEVCETGFLSGDVIVPQFVLAELQYIADSPDPMKRARGKRGLDVLNEIQRKKAIAVKISDRDFPSIREVDRKLIALAREIGARILTNDSNLTKVAELQGVEVLNLNRLAAALKPVALPGEVMNIQVVKEGKEAGQGVGYLEDGTMVVIENARPHMGKAVDVSITSVLQTAGGRMIFSKLKDELKRAVYQ